MKLETRSTLAAALAAGFLIAVPHFAAAEADAPPPPEQRGEPGERPLRDGPGRGLHGPHAGGPFLQALRSLDLSEAQRSSVRTAIQASVDAERSQHAATRELRHKVMIATPDSAGYGALVNQLAEAEANAARDRVQKAAALKGELYAMLTAPQKAKLAETLKNLPPPPAPGERPGGKPPR